MIGSVLVELLLVGPAPYMQGQLATRVAGVLDRDGLRLRITLSWREERAGQGKGGERGNRKRERVRLVMGLSKIETCDVVGPDGNVGSCSSLLRAVRALTRDGRDRAHTSGK